MDTDVSDKHGASILQIITVGWGCR